MSKSPVPATIKKPPPPSNRSTKAMEFASAGSKGELARLNANIRKDLHRKLKARAAMDDKTIGQMIEEWIEGLPTPK